MLFRLGRKGNWSGRVRLVSARNLRDNTHQLVRVIRRTKARGAANLLPFRKPMRDAARVDDIDGRIGHAGGFRGCQASRGVLELYVHDQNTDARICAKDIKSVFHTACGEYVVAIPLKPFLVRTPVNRSPGTRSTSGCLAITEALKENMIRAHG